MIEHASTPGRDDVTRVGELPLDTLEWYASEVPPIVADLRESQAISASTANTAWQLIEAGAYDRALALALDEAV